MNEDLSALVFELQRAGSKVDKAKALARAWRTIRGLSGTERRLLAREVGFDGADDLIEGLAGKSGGVFAPAAVLEALGKLRRDEGLTLRGVLSGLRDPEMRDDLLVRGIDLLADSVERPETDFEPKEWTDGTVDLEVPPPAPFVREHREIVDSDVRADDEEETLQEPDFDGTVETKPPPSSQSVEPPVRDVVVDPEVSEDPELGTGSMPEAADPSSWDEMWAAPESMAVVPSFVGRAERPEAGRTQGTVLTRLRAFREAIPGLKKATGDQIRDALDDLPEAWARRRAVVALIEADVPDDVARTLDLIEDLDREMDRRWCLSTLAVRGDLTGNDLERALGMLTSPAARRRVEGLARAACG